MSGGTHPVARRENVRGRAPRLRTGEGALFGARGFLRGRDNHHRRHVVRMYFGPNVDHPRGLALFAFGGTGLLLTRSALPRSLRQFVAQLFTCAAGSTAAVLRRPAVQPVAGRPQAAVTSGIG